MWNSPLTHRNPWVASKMCGIPGAIEELQQETVASVHETSRRGHVCPVSAQSAARILKAGSHFLSPVSTAASFFPKTIWKAYTGQEGSRETESCVRRLPYAPSQKGTSRNPQAMNLALLDENRNFLSKAGTPQRAQKLAERIAPEYPVNIMYCTFSPGVILRPKHVLIHKDINWSYAAHNSQSIGEQDLLKGKAWEPFPQKSPPRWYAESQSRCLVKS